MGKGFTNLPGKARGLLWAASIIAAGVTLWILLYPQSRHPDTTGVECFSHAQTKVVTFFYEPGTSEERLHTILASTHSSVIDTYKSLHGYSLSVPASSVKGVLAMLLDQPEVTAAKTSPAQSCIDPD